MNQLMVKLRMLFLSLLSCIGLTLSLVVQAETHHVEIKKFKFVPQHIEVKPGDTVIWTNKEKRQYHSVWFQSLTQEEPEYFFPDETYTQTFNDTGSFDYICGPHPEMTGSVSVK